MVGRERVRHSTVSGRAVVRRVAVGAGLTVVGVVVCCLWGVGSFQLALQAHPTNFGSNLPVGFLWMFLSAFVFVLATGGVAMIIAYGVDRGRPAIWIHLAVAAVVIVLFTWGYVAATDAAMSAYDNSAPPSYPQPTGR
jgi:hypothetical protein